MHEHVFVLSPEIHNNYPEVWGDESERQADAVTRLNELKSRGVDTIVDLTVIGLGRYIPRIAQIAAQTKTTSWWQRASTPTTTCRCTSTSAGPDTPLGGANRGRHVRQRHRKGHSGHRHQGGNPQVRHRRARRDARRRAGAARGRAGTPRTGVPISTHTHAATRRGLDQQRIFAEEGVDLTRVVIGHSGDSTDLDYLEELIGAGSYHRHGPLRRRRHSSVSRTESTPSRRCASADTPERWCSRTTRRA